MEQLKLIVKIINCMEILILSLDNNTSAYRNAISNVVKKFVEDNFSDHNDTLTVKADILCMHEYIYYVPEKKCGTKKKYINGAYNILKNFSGDEELEFLKHFHKELNIVCRLITHT